MIREVLRKILLMLLNWLEKKPKIIKSDKRPFWSKEIHLSTQFIIIISIFFIFFTLMIELEPSLNNLIGLLISISVGIWIFIKLLKTGSPELVKDNDAMMLLSLIIIISIIGIYIIKPIHELSAFLTPIAGMVLLTALLLDRNIALMVSLTISLIGSIVNKFDFSYMFFHLFGSFCAVIIYDKIKHRQDIFYAGIKIGLMNFVALTIINLFKEIDYNFNELVKCLLLSGINGLISSGVVFILLSPLETFFSRITDIKLLELADFNQPLLKRLMLEAPGTYHHSLTVASIAEHAANAINANALLARVGAYYHDIGKLIKPEYFIENQVAIENPHNNISPTMSGLVVISHVKEGVNLAKKNNLDKPIIDLIEQHHGNSLLYSIYQKALEKIEISSETEFRYPGPKPKTKEAAILMISDSCEAAARTLDEPSPSRLKDMVEKIINNKFTDGQLNDAPLTLSDMNKIADSIVETLIGIHHVRIEYEIGKEKNG